jgi:hypothetical protein
LLKLEGRENLYVVATSGGKFLLTNEPLATTTLLPVEIEKFKPSGRS